MQFITILPGNTDKPFLRLLQKEKMVGHLAKGSVNKPHARNKAIERLNCTLRERVKGAKRMKPELTPFCQEGIIRT
jgi:hypothetical protein